MKTTPVLSAFAICAASIVIAAEPVPPFSGSIERLDPKLDTLIAPEAKIEVLASGFNWAEGPVWYQIGRAHV